MLGYDSVEAVISRATPMPYKYPEQQIEIDTELRQNGSIKNLAVALLDQAGNERMALLSMIREGDALSAILTDVTANNSHERSVSARVMSEPSEGHVAYQAALLHHIGDAVIATDLEFRITSWNRGAENMYGWRSGGKLSANWPPNIWRRTTQIRTAKKCCTKSKP